MLKEICVGCVVGIVTGVATAAAVLRLSANQAPRVVIVERSDAPSAPPLVDEQHVAQPKETSSSETQTLIGSFIQSLNRF